MFGLTPRKPDVVYLEDAHLSVTRRPQELICTKYDVGKFIKIISTSHPWMILLGRFLAGAGAGCEVPLYADIVRITSTQERTPYIVTLLLCRQFGLIIGPACTLVMKQFEFKIGKVTFDVYNGPGLLLAILWAIHTLLVFLIYPQICNVHAITLENEFDPLVSSESLEGNEKTSTKCFRGDNYSEYCTYEVVTILCITFSSYLSLMALETVLPPMASRYFRWSEVETSYVYLGCGLLVIVVYLFLRLISSNGVMDRKLLLVGLFFLFISYFWLSVSLSLIEKNKRTLYIVLIIVGIGFHVLGQPFCVSCSESLFTKQVRLSDQDRAQSILRMVINVALLVGPFVGGSMESDANVVFLILFMVVVVSLLLFICKYASFSYEFEDPS